MQFNLDNLIVILYLLIIAAVSFFTAKKHSKSSNEDFMTGGHHLPWWKTGMTLIAMMFDNRFSLQEFIFCKLIFFGHNIFLNSIELETQRLIFPGRSIQ